MTSQQKLIFDIILSTLNEAVNLDQNAINNLISTRVDCNIKLANHPTIQVLEVEPSWRNIRTKSDKPKYEIGFLGILNGVVENLTGESIAASFDDGDKLINFIQYQKNI